MLSHSNAIVNTDMLFIFILSFFTIKDRSAVNSNKKNYSHQHYNLIFRYLIILLIRLCNLTYYAA